jgi:hypothetical protein
MAKKNTGILFFIIGFLISISICFFFYYYSNLIGSNLIENIQGIGEPIKGTAAKLKDHEDDFTINLKVDMLNKGGLIVPHPYGSYTVSTTSGKHSISTDISMNNPIYIKTTLDVDGSNNIMNRTVTIKPKSTGVVPYCGSLSETAGTDCDPNKGDVIPNVFTLDISFNQVTYQLETIASLKAKELPYKYINHIDSNRNLLISVTGPIYDSTRNKIGDVNLDTTDMYNENSFSITVQNPKNTYFNLNSIVITFIVMLPIATLAPTAPPAGATSSLMNKLPALDPNMTTDQLLDN